MPRPSPTPSPRLATLAGVMGLVLLATLLPAPLSAQDDEVRIGITLGGTSFVGLAVEFFDGDRSLEITVGTWAARDLSVSVVGRQYFGRAAMKPVVGAGLWTVLSWPPEGGTGASLVARAPVGFDWNAGGDHFFTFDMNVNRALWVKRPDPDDSTPPNQRLVPLPGVSYRWRR